MIIKQNENESRRRIENFYSLNRSKLERFILDMNLIVILVIATSLYIFFSLPYNILHMTNFIKSNSTLFSDV